MSYKNAEEEIIYPYKKSGKTYHKVQEMAKEIVKLQKENKELKNQIEQWTKTCCDFADEREKLLKTPVFTVNEIKKLIGYEENEDVSKDEIISLLKTMWEEFNRLEDIEDFTATQCISKKKIKEKKDWYQETMKHLCKNGIDLDRYERYEEVVNFCKELLGDNE